MRCRPSQRSRRNAARSARRLLIARAVGADDEGQRPQQPRRDARQRAPLADRLARVTEASRLQRAQAAVRGALVVERGRGGEVARPRPARPSARAPPRRARSRGRGCRRRRRARRRSSRPRPRSRAAASGNYIVALHVTARASITKHKITKIESSCLSLRDCRERSHARQRPVRDYWNSHIHDLDISSNAPGSREFFADLDQYHFEKLHHLPRLIDFNAYRGKKVLDVGCGAGTDLARFAQGRRDRAPAWTSPRRRSRWRSRTSRSRG